MNLINYTVYRSSRKSIRLVMRTDGTLAVYCPRRCSKQLIEQAVAKHYSDLKSKHDARGDTLFENNTLPYLGVRYPIIYNNVKKFSFNGSQFICPITDSEIIREMYREFLRKESKKLIPPTVAQIANEFNFNYNKISIKSVSSRFGSCSAKKNLNFSLALAAFDTEFINFVICHELCHTVHLNHSNKFYALLDTVYPRHREIKNQNSDKRSAILKGIFFNPAS